MHLIQFGGGDDVQAITMGGIFAVFDFGEVDVVVFGTDDVDFYYNQGAKITFVDYNSRSWYVTCKDFDKEWDSIVKSIQDYVDYPLIN